MSFSDWYDQYERDGGELLLFNSIDLEEAYVAGHEEGSQKIPLDYVERLERSNSSLQQQADRGVHCAMKLRIATEHLLTWRTKAVAAERDRDRYRSLVDGATTIVELYVPESPAQKQWKENWLNQANTKKGESP